MTITIKFEFTWLDGWGGSITERTLAARAADGGCVRMYSVACSRLLVLSSASLACSQLNPISISWQQTKTHSRSDICLKYVISTGSQMQKELVIF